MISLVWLIDYLVRQFSLIASRAVRIAEFRACAARPIGRSASLLERIPEGMWPGKALVGVLARAPARVPPNPAAHLASGDTLRGRSVC